MDEVFAGFVSGYTLALLSTPLLAVLLVRLRTGSAVMARILPPTVSTMSLAVLLHGVLFLLLTCLGIVLGLVLFAMEDAGAALGSPNAPFTLFVGATIVMLMAPIAIALPQLRPSLLAAAVLTVAVFGWLMPHMATWADFERPETPRERIEVFHA